MGRPKRYFTILHHQNKLLEGNFIITIIIVSLSKLPELPTSWIHHLLFRLWGRSRTLPSFPFSCLRREYLPSMCELRQLIEVLPTKS